MLLPLPKVTPTASYAVLCHAPSSKSHAGGTGGNTRRPLDLAKRHRDEHVYDVDVRCQQYPVLVRQVHVYHMVLRRRLGRLLFGSLYLCYAIES
jgi:hypothetical protein